MKHMKKSMFISTVLMVVLLVVAVSTATFAWFSANDTVTVQETTMTAATTTDANILIGWEEGNLGTHITFENPGEFLAPMIPAFAPASTGEAISQLLVYTNSAHEYTAFPKQTFTYAGDSITDLRVTNFNEEQVIAIDNVAVGETYFQNATITGTPGNFSRIYRQGYYKEAHFLVTSATTAVTEEIEIDGISYGYLNIVDAIPTLPNQISVEQLADFQDYLDVKGITLVGNLEYVEGMVGSPAGLRVYYISEVKDTFRVVNYLGAAPSNFIEEGMNYGGGDDADYYTIVPNTENLGLGIDIEGMYYINIIDETAGTQLGDTRLNAAAEGDYIYCLRQAGTASATTTFEDFTENFYGATVGHGIRFLENGSFKSPYLSSEADGSANAFLVQNAGSYGAPSARVDMTISFTGEDDTPLVNQIRVAIFVAEGNSTTFNYLDTICASGDNANTYYGAVLKGARGAAANLNSYDAKTATSQLPKTIATLGPQEHVQIRLAAWYDGVGLTDVLGGDSVSFKIEFKGTTLG